MHARGAEDRWYVQPQHQIRVVSNLQNHLQLPRRVFLYPLRLTTYLVTVCTT